LVLEHQITGFIRMNELKGSELKWSWPILRYCSCSCLQGLKKTIETSLAWHSNLGHPKYIAGMPAAVVFLLSLYFIVTVSPPPLSVVQQSCLLNVFKIHIVGDLKMDRKSGWMSWPIGYTSYLWVRFKFQPRECLFFLGVVFWVILPCKLICLLTQNINNT
jgi:hypothetical protein